MARKTTQQFIADAKKVHGNKYRYGNVKYINNNTNVDIDCPDHGLFQQLPRTHLSGSGCKKCADISAGNKLRSNKDVFIEKAKKVHGEKYGYNNVVYVDSKTRVKLECFDHGIFEQEPRLHLFGHGCQKCADKENGDRMRKTQDQFITEANKVHNNKYGYGNVNYIDSRIEVDIDCPDHGIFSQAPNSHLLGHGCPTCGNKKVADVHRKSLENFIIDSQKIYGTKYDYSLTKYINRNTELELIDRDTGKTIKITPKQHLRTKCRGEGCNTHMNPRYGSYCAFCFHHLFPNHELSKNFKTKEKSVGEFIAKLYEHFEITFDKCISHGSSKRRPDILFHMENYVIIIEIDENQHKSYDTACERSRDCEIYNDLRKKVVFIRFNPDCYTINGERVSSCWKPTPSGVKLIDKDQWNQRLKRLEKSIDFWMTYEPAKEITYKYLFFDKN